MSALAFCNAIVMSALPPIADMCGATRDVRLGLISDLSQFLGFQIIRTLLAIDSVGSEKTEMMSHPLN
ncbi:MAG: hypothetical protein WCB47_21800, partial [Pseudolabrys sp.]